MHAQARSRDWNMATTTELVQTICQLIRASPTPIPIASMNHGVDETAAIIGAVVERCARDNIALTGIFIDPDLADELWGHREPHDRPLADTRRRRDRPQYGVHLQRQAARREDDRARVERPLCPRGQRSARRKPHAPQRAAHRRRNRQWPSMTIGYGAGIMISGLEAK